MAAEIGQWVWFDLMTTDLTAAKAFYTAVAGWKAVKWDGGDYEMFSAADRTIGGLMALPKEAKQAGAPPHWMGYASTPDVNAASTRVEKLGGKVLMPAQDIPDVGRFAVVADPQGASFALFSPRNMKDTAPGREGLGHFSWAELNTTDHVGAWRFYSELLGWKKTRTMDMGPGGEYLMFGADPEKSFGGMSDMAKQMKVPAHWLFYFNVASADETAKVVKDKGGKVLNGPMDIPPNDRIAQCMDPQGAMFAVYSEGKK